MLYFYVPQGCACTYRHIFSGGCTTIQDKYMRMCYEARINYTVVCRFYDVLVHALLRSS